MKNNGQVVLSFDIGLDRLDASLSAPDGEWLIGHHPYANNWLGYQELKKDVLAHLANLEEPQLAVVGESTGRYWWHIFSPKGRRSALFINQMGIVRVILISGW